MLLHRGSFYNQGDVDTLHDPYGISRSNYVARVHDMYCGGDSGSLVLQWEPTATAARVTVRASYPCSIARAMLAGTILNSQEIGKFAN